jgi:hypothetical protein
MRLGIILMLLASLLAAAPRKKSKVKPVPMQKLELSEALRKELSGVLFGVSLNDKFEVSIDMESPTEEGASQLEKMAGVLVAAEQLKSEAGVGQVLIEVPKASRVSRSGRVVRTTVSLTDEQLEKLLEHRYGRKLLTEAKNKTVYVHGLAGGMKSYPWGEGVVVDLRK